MHKQVTDQPKFLPYPSLPIISFNANGKYVKDTIKYKECFPNVKQAFLLYQVGSLVILIAY